MDHYSFDIFQWAVVVFNAGGALYSWFNLRNKPQAMFFCATALYLTDLFPVREAGMVLLPPALFLMLRQRGASSH